MYLVVTVASPFSQQSHTPGKEKEMRGWRTLILRNSIMWHRVGDLEAATSTRDGTVKTIY